MTVGLATGSIVAAPGQLVSLSSLFTVTPGVGNPQYLIVSGLDRNEYTASSTNSTGTLSGNGHTLGFSTLQTTNGTGVDTLTVRPFNGTYWGDWQSMNVNVGVPSVSGSSTSATPQYAAPMVPSRTTNQVWRANRNVSFAVPGNTFADPQGLGMTYAAYQVGGRSADWLHFNSASGQFTGTPPEAGKFTIEVEVVATNSAGLDAAETFDITIAPNAAKFAQAMSAVHHGWGAAGAIAGSPVETSAIPRLASPIA